MTPPSHLPQKAMGSFETRHEGRLLSFFRHHTRELSEDLTGVSGGIAGTLNPSNNKAAGRDQTREKVGGSRAESTLLDSE